MDETKISVIIITYYSKHLLKTLINNINNKVDNIGEILIVNNSPDDLAEFSNIQIKILQISSNIGYGAAINQGLKFAKFNNILIINPDILLTKFNIDITKMSSNCFIIGGIRNNNWNYRKFPILIFSLINMTLLNVKYIKWLSKIVHRVKSINNKKEFITVDWIRGDFILTNKNTMNRLNGFDEGLFLYYEEIDLCKNASYLSIPVYINSNIEYISDDIKKSSSINVDNIKMKASIISMYKYYIKHGKKKNVENIFKLFKYVLFLEKLIFQILFNLLRINWLKKKYVMYSIYYNNI